MKILDVLREGMEFHACVMEPNEHGGHNITPHGWRRVKERCFVCKGTGKDHGNECDLCRGDGEIDEYVSDSPSLQVSNSNGFAIIEKLLKQKGDYSGMVKKEDLPELRRQLIHMKNSDKERSKLHRDNYDNSKDRKMTKQHVKDNTVKIGHNMPHVMDIGRTDEQVKRYIDTLLHMVEYAMKHDCVLSWA